MRKPDFNDFLIVTGMTTAGVGLWFLAPWLSLLFVGVFMAVLGIAGSLR